jgi:hypothetical protein
MSTKKSSTICSSCGGREGQHRLSCAQNRCRCGAPGTLGGICSVCFWRVKKEQEARKAEYLRQQRQAVIARKLAELDH